MASFTEKAIMDSFIKLLNAKPLDKITVKDIVEDCGINRNTFYYHFDDIPTLVTRILEDETNRALSLHGDVHSWEEGFIAAAQFALSNKRLIYHIYNSVSRAVSVVKGVYRSFSSRKLRHTASVRVLPDTSVRVSVGVMWHPPPRSPG